MMNYFHMFVIMIFSGLLSSMSVWANKWSDVRLSLNDLYMSLLMAGWMIFFMSILDNYSNGIVISLIIIVGSFIAIRTQLFVNQKQFLLGMIPHHSMAITMSKKLLEKPNNIQKLLKDIIKSQGQEIKFMKEKLNFYKST